MSVIASNHQQIANSPLNKSTAKQLYSIPKSKRQDLTLKNQCSVAFYDLPPVRSTRAAGFGYSNKYDFTKGQATTPAPNNYNQDGNFSTKNNQKKGFSFGLSREQMAATGGMTVGEKNSPGPGAYNVRGLNKTNIAFTFRPRTTSEAVLAKKNVPGPGAYNLAETISKDGKYYVSKYRNSGASVIAPRSQRQGLYSTSNVPGPGAYDPQGTFSTTGNYFVSKFRSSLCRSFGHSMRKSLTTIQPDETPGPGSYRLPSEFGYYESKNNKQMELTMKSARSQPPGTSKSSERPHRIAASHTQPQAAEKENHNESKPVEEPVETKPVEPTESKPVEAEPAAEN